MCSNADAASAEHDEPSGHPCAGQRAQQDILYELCNYDKIVDGGIISDLGIVHDWGVGRICGLSGYGRETRKCGARKLTSASYGLCCGIRET